jgi:hypothetical protein
MKKIVPGIIAALIAMPLMFEIHAAATSPVQAKKAAAGKSSVTLTVLNPQGPVKKNRELAPRLGTLKGKKIALWLSATRGQLYAGKGAELYDLLEKMLKEKYPDIRIVPYMALPMKFSPENEVVAAIEKTRPDGVVAAFGG